MATRFLTFLYLFSRPIPKADVTNSWATICLWRRFFQLEDQKEDENELSRETNYRADGSVVGDNVDVWTPAEADPVRSPWAREELMELRRSTSSRRLDDSNSPSFRSQRAPSDVNAPPTTPSTSLDHPDLRVNGMFLPQ